MSQTDIHVSAAEIVVVTQPSQAGAESAHQGVDESCCLIVISIGIQLVLTTLLSALKKSRRRGAMVAVRFEPQH